MESLDISFIDIQKEIFINEKDPFNFIPFLYESGVHYNIEGYKKVAETIHNFDK